MHRTELLPTICVPLQDEGIPLIPLPNSTTSSDMNMICASTDYGEFAGLSFSSLAYSVIVSIGSLFLIASYCREPAVSSVA